jgi:tetratricopeptide (TPR) repeat protein
MSERIKLWILGAVLFVAVLFTYSNHWHNSFHFDDAHTIQNNLYITKLEYIPCYFMNDVEPCNTRAAKTFSSIPSHGSYRPVVTTSLAIDYWMGDKFAKNGYDTFYYHLSMFTLFLIQGVLMFFFLKKIFESVSLTAPAAYLALFGTAFYMLHPALAETLNYIISRSDSISTAFLIAGFVMYQYWKGGRKFYLYLIPIVIGAMAKPTAIMFGPMLVMYHLLFEQKKALLDLKNFDWKTLLLTTVPAFALAIFVYVFFRYMETGFFEGGGYSLKRYIVTQPYIYLHYVGQFLLPMQLSADTDWGTFSTLLDPRAIIGFLFTGVMLITILLASQEERLRPISFGLSFFLIALIPTTIVPLAEVMNDHRVFFPYVGLVIAGVWALYLALQKVLDSVPQVAVLAVAMIVLSGYAYGTHHRNAVWKDEKTLWKDVTEKSPKNGRGLMNYGLVMMGEGNYDEAEKYFNAGLKMWPYYSLLHVNMGVVQEAKKNFTLAEQYYKNGVTYGQSYPSSYYYYARFLSNQKRNAEAIPLLYSSLKLYDSDKWTRYLLMDCLYEQKRNEELKQVAAVTLQLLPGDPKSTTYVKLADSGLSQLQLAEKESANYTQPGDFLNLSLLYYQAADYEKCIEAAQKALKIKADYAEAWNNICSAYNAMNKFEEGVKACEEALKIKPDYALAAGNLNYAKSQLKK